jgi:4-amino-4-deoxy-L-arabinose transferase-like glycosyltransferase
MDVDATQYAAISREMLDRGDLLHFTDRGVDYLDKPPLTFWLTGLFMKVFGVNHFAGRFVALLTTLLAVYSTFRLGALYDNRRTGYLAAVILATTQAVFLMNHDVRTDLNLMAWNIFSLWQLCEFLEFRKHKNLVLGFVGIALAMLSKGPIGIVVPGLAIGSHLLLRGEWLKMFDIRWIGGILITGMFLLPMMYGLYTQFDIHPEKVVNGERAVSGLHFFFWTQSFGRITGESVWTNDAGPFFLSHTTLWAFAPWSFLLLAGLWHEGRRVLMHFRKDKEKQEFIIGMSFILPLIALSASRYQLPHYAFVVYPAGAILTARYIHKGFGKRERSSVRPVRRIHTGLVILANFVLFAVISFSFPERQSETMLLFFVGLFVIVLVHLVDFRVHRMVLLTITVAIFNNLMLNAIFYPELLRYQAGSVAAQTALKSGLKDNALYAYRVGVPNSLIFYSGQIVRGTNNLDSLAGQKDVWVYMNPVDTASVRAQGIDFEMIQLFDTFHVTELTAQFLNPSTRPLVTEKRCVIKW